jgi:hypothetical protein
VARAKRTNRAEARRRYRAYLQSLEEAAAAEAQGAEEAEEAEEAAGSKPSRSRAERARPVPQPGARTGILDSLRAAYRKPTYISDVKYLPTLVGRTHAVWPVLAISVVACVYAANAFRNNPQDPILPWIFTLVFYPPMIPPMVAGYLAPRATWLAGLIAGFLGPMAFVVAVAISGVKFTSTGLVSPSPTPTATQVASASATLASAAIATSMTSPTATPAATPTPGVSTASASAATSTPTTAASVTPEPSATATPSTTATPSVAPASPSSAASPTSNGTASGATDETAFSELLGYAPFLLLQTMAIGAMIGALSGWYKRFLELAAPRGSRSRSQGGRKPQQRRPAARR